MKYEMTQDDLDIMKRDMEQNRTLKHLKNMTFYKFSVGDILIREERYRQDASTYEWKPYLADCGLPYKYMYVFENELGVGYIRRLSINGRKFVESPTCVLEYDPNQTRFSLDPEYADHLLLAPEDESFDAKARYNEMKKKREAMQRKNKKLRISFETGPEAVEFINNLAVGTQFWYGYSASTVNKDPYVVVEKGVDEARRYRGASHEQKPEDLPWFSYTRNNGYAYKIYANQLLKSNSTAFYLQRPLFFDELPM